MSNTIKKLKEIFDRQLDAPVKPEFLNYFLYETSPGLEEYKMQKIALKDLKELKDHVFVKNTEGVNIIPIFSPPQVQDDNSNEA